MDDIHPLQRLFVDNKKPWYIVANLRVTIH